jgi:hypothetical protein
MIIPCSHALAMFNAKKFVLQHYKSNQMGYFGCQEVLAPRVEIDMPALTRYDNSTIAFRFSAVNAGDSQSGNLKNIKGHTT